MALTLINYPRLGSAYLVTYLEMVSILNKLSNFTCNEHNFSKIKMTNFLLYSTMQN